MKAGGLLGGLKPLPKDADRQDVFAHVFGDSIYYDPPISTWADLNKQHKEKEQNDGKQKRNH